jgi:hypothetical protein
MKPGQLKRTTTHCDHRGHRAFWAAVVAIVASMVLSGQAWSEGSIVIVFSTGNKSCGEYLRAAEAERKARPVHPEANSIYSMDYLDFASYADGFLTGANATASSLASTAGQNTDLWGRMVWLEKYYGQNPLQWYVNALGALKRYLVEHNQ